jgi:hypothetical protein
VEIQGLRSSKSKPVVATRIILHGKAAGNASVRTAVRAVRQNSHPVEVRVTWEPGDAARLTAEAVADAGAGKVTCIVDCDVGRHDAKPGPPAAAEQPNRQPVALLLGSAIARADTRSSRSASIPHFLGSRGGV